MLFTIALNSYRGVFGSTHGHTYSPLVKGARLEATDGIGRLMWGMGVFYHHILGRSAWPVRKNMNFRRSFEGLLPTCRRRCGTGSATRANWKSGAIVPLATGK